MKNEIDDNTSPLGSWGSLIQTTPHDNVGIVANPTGLKKGDLVLAGILLQEDIPMGHKVALTSFEKDDAVVRYGQTIGYAKNAIAKGSWINERNINLPQPPNLNEIPYIKNTTSPVEPLDGYTFQGYTSARSGGDTCAAGLRIRLPSGGCDEHPSAHGQQVLAAAVQRAIGRNP